MVKHIVMWKYKEELTRDAIEKLEKDLKKGAEDMNGNIKGLIKAVFMKNVNEKEYHDICLYCEFESFEDVENYQDDPVHVAFKNIIVPNVKDRVCIDCVEA